MPRARHLSRVAPWCCMRTHSLFISVKLSSRKSRASWIDPPSPSYSLPVSGSSPRDTCQHSRQQTDVKSGSDSVTGRVQHLLQGIQASRAAQQPACCAFDDEAAAKDSREGQEVSDSSDQLCRQALLGTSGRRQALQKLLCRASTCLGHSFPTQRHALIHHPMAQV